MAVMLAGPAMAADMLRMSASFDADGLAALGGGAVPKGPVSGRFDLIMPALAQADGLQVEERVGIVMMRLKIDEYYFVPRQTRAVLTALDGKPIRLVIGALPDGPHALAADSNDFKLVFSRGDDSAPGTLSFEEFSLTLAGTGQARFLAIAGRGQAQAKAKAFP